jgi:nitrate/nitrite transporter NarK
MSAEDNSSDLRGEPIGDLLRRLSEETSTLVRQELDLAKAELREKGRAAGAGAGMLGGAGIAALLMLAALSATAIAALDTAMATWVAALIVTVIWAAVAAVLALTGRDRLQAATPPVPEQTQDSVKEDVEWAKSRARSATR